MAFARSMSLAKLWGVPVDGCVALVLCGVTFGSALDRALVHGKTSIDQQNQPPIPTVDRALAMLLVPVQVPLHGK